MRYDEILGEANEPKWIGTQYSDMKQLRAAVEKAWGSSEFESKLVKRKGSARGFELGTRHLINPQGQVVGYWELTGADMIPGRGTVTQGYGQVAAPEKTPKASKTKAAPAEPTTPATLEEISKATAELARLVKASGAQYITFNTISDSQFDVQDWGEWEVPADVEDDEDYDWKVLSDESSAKLKQLVDQVQAVYPNVKFDVMTEEKNWITFQMGSKL